MIRTLVHTFLLAIFATTGVAQTVQVRSGEHDGFTRLVLNLPARAAWSIERYEGSAMLRIDRPGLRFDPGDVFVRANRNRLRDLRPENSTLAMELACACDVSAFWHGVSMLVVDIADPKDAPVETGAAVTAGESIPLPDLAARDTEMPGQGRSAAAQLFAEVIEPPAALNPRTPEMHFDPQHAPVAGWNGLQDTREALLQQFGRAASQGLLSPRTTWQAQSQSRDKPAPEAEQALADPEPPEPLNDTAASHINLRAESSVDRDFGTSMAAQIGLEAASGCLSPRDVNPLAWGGQADFSTELGELRAKLTGEFDRIDTATSVRLARLYIYYGFGAEAAQVLNTVPEPSRDTAILTELADILETGHARSGRMLAGQMQCAPMVALWSALSQRALPEDMPIDSDAILRAFSTLPPHLRSYLGPMLSRRFLAASHKDVSEKVLRILNRSDATVTAESRIADAEVDFAEAHDAPADATLTEVVETNAPPAAEALLTQTEKRLQRGAEISYDQAQLIGSYAFENRGTLMGKDLARVHLAALAASGAFDESHEHLDAYLSDHSEDETVVREAFLKSLTDAADDMMFLKHVFAGHGGDPAQLDTRIGNAVAARLLELGFPGGAGTFLAPPATGAGNRVRKLLRAEAALLGGRPRQAEVDLLGLTGKDANLLRARARSMVGEHAAALDLYLSADLPGDAQREAWLARDWARIDAPDAPDYVALALARAGEEGAALEPTDGVLAQNRQLLSGSEEVRNAIEDLLAANPAPDLTEGH